MASRRFGKLFALTSAAKTAGRQKVKESDNSSSLPETKAWLTHSASGFFSFIRANALGIVIIAAATIIFFWPLVIRIDSYSPGGDAMFNAWTLARDQHCILRQACPHYADANIYFPHKDTMLYSETQLSAGLLTLPLYLINHNPLFAYNVWTIVSFFLTGLFMYLLAKYISKKNELFSVVAGLIFEFAPYKMAAIYHLQNLSIFCLPLIILMILRFFDTSRGKYLIGLFVLLLYQFYASWYQMVFTLIAVGILIVGFLLLRRANIRQSAWVTAAVVAALVATLPLAIQYVQFSKHNKATFGIADQALYSSSVADYLMPSNNTLEGRVVYGSNAQEHANAYNLDSNSYSGYVLLIITFVVVILSYIQRRKSVEQQVWYKDTIIYVVMGLVGLILSLGPLLKLEGTFQYTHLVPGLSLAIPLPYILVDKYLTQLSFIRAIGRINVLVLFMVCIMLARFAYIMKTSKLSLRTRRVVAATVIVLLGFELMPLHILALGKSPYMYNLKIPALYSYINNHKNINNLVILQANNYPGVTTELARPETVLWAGYDNRNLFNGYSGYTPPTYFADHDNFVNNFPANVTKMKHLGIKYVVVDKMLTKTRPHLLGEVTALSRQKVYQDKRYDLFQL